MVIAWVRLIRWCWVTYTDGFLHLLNPSCKHFVHTEHYTTYTHLCIFLHSTCMSKNYEIKMSKYHIFQTFLCWFSNKHINICWMICSILCKIELISQTFTFLWNFQNGYIFINYRKMSLLLFPPSKFFCILTQSQRHMVCHTISHCRPLLLFSPSKFFFAFSPKVRGIWCVTQ